MLPDVLSSLVPLTNPHDRKQGFLDRIVDDPLLRKAPYPGSENDPLLDGNTPQSTNNNDALNQFLDPSSSVEPVGILTINDIWGIVAVAGGAGLAIAVSEVFETSKFFGVIPVWQRIAWTMLVTFISILLATIVVRSARRILRILRVEIDYWIGRTDRTYRRDK